MCNGTHTVLTGTLCLGTIEYTQPATLSPLCSQPTALSARCAPLSPLRSALSPLRSARYTQPDTLSPLQADGPMKLKIQSLDSIARGE